LDGNVVTVGLLSFFSLDYSPLPSSYVPLVGGVHDTYVSIDTSLFKASSLMGCFPLQLPKVSQMVNMLSSIPHEHTNPWILLAPSDLDTYRDQMPLSPTELAYQAIQSASASLVTLVTTNSTTTLPINSPPFDLLDQVLPMNGAIREIMSFRE